MEEGVRNKGTQNISRVNFSFKNTGNLFLEKFFKST